MKLTFYQLNYPGFIKDFKLSTCISNLKNLFLKDGYPDLNREHTVPHTVVLPIEL